ncbi:energy transducer TonB [Vibrio sp. ZSDZ34]|uniref:Protein TonB n=1 Tax=Vibrio gelatinilyticus TaxID=2893468 RepID=A0A9X2AV11_9VIBR|nr:energy transducer TonB [Vibrio gelatinilyticus]MCJ2375880.1 energy transducer TonB [Vibrio gelatinilyticus]
MVRLLASIPLAAVSALILFSLMSWMIDIGPKSKPDEKPRLSYELVMVEPNSETTRRQRVLPEPPKMPSAPPSAAIVEQSSHVSSVQTPSTPQLPNIAVSTQVTGVALNAPTVPDIGQNQQVMPLHRKEPRYPRRALQRNIEGYVVMSFTIDESGRPTDIKVLEAKPTRVFEREAMVALKQWKYQPMVVNGTATARIGQTVKLEFKLNQ